MSTETASDASIEGGDCDPVTARNNNLQSEEKDAEGSTHLLSDSKPKENNPAKDVDDPQQSGAVRFPSSVLTMRWPKEAAALISSKLPSLKTAITLHGFDDVPKFLKRNPYIRAGYRVYLSPQMCLQSAFWWTNETMNIWTHIIGGILFAMLLLYDNLYLASIFEATTSDKIVLTLTLLCFQFCMVCSASYHMFNCHSEKTYEQWLFWDLLGVTLALTAVFNSGIWFAFHCYPILRAVYISSVTVLFALVVSTQLHPTYTRDKFFHVRLALYLAWAVYGVVPTLHWVYLYSDSNSRLVQVMLPRVWAMYGISGAGFVFYISRFPERVWPGVVDYIGSSHQWWHILVVLAMYWWHNTGVTYAQYRKMDICPTEDAPF